jgi:hypothetical protein
MGDARDMLYAQDQVFRGLFQLAARGILLGKLQDLRK